MEHEDACTSGVSPDQLQVREGYFLPHWELRGATYHVVFCLRDSLPRHVVKQFIEERDRLLKEPVLTEEQRSRLAYLVSNKIAKYLDTGCGTCLLRRPEIAAGVQGAL